VQEEEEETKMVAEVELDRQVVEMVEEQAVTQLLTQAVVVVEVITTLVVMADQE
jgi:hypothetical protein